MHNSINETLNLKEVLRGIASNLFGVFVIFFVLFAIWANYFFTSERTYQIKSLVKIDDSNSFNPFFESSPVFDFYAANLIEEQKIYASRTNFITLIKQLGLNLYIDGRKGDISNASYDNLELSESSIPVEKFEVLLQSNSYEVLLPSGQKLNFKYNVQNNLDNRTIKITRNPSLDYEDKNIKVSVLSIENAYKIEKSILSINPVSSRPGRDNSLLTVSYFTSDPDFGENVVNSMNEVYKKYSITSKSEQAKSSLSFLTERADNVSDLLKISEQKLSAFHQNSNLFIQAEESKTALQEISDLDKQIYELNLREIEFRSVYKDSNTALETLLEQKKLLEEKRNDVLVKINSLPQKEQDFVNLSRGVEINQNALEYLLTRKLEFSIAEASTMSDLVVIDEAYTDRLVSPVFLPSLLITIFISMILGLFYAITKHIFFSPFKTPNQIIESNYPMNFLGTISRLGDDEKINQMDSKIELVGSVLTNLSIMLDGSNKVLVTGPLKGIGKTFTSTIIAKEMYSQGKSVALLDFDYRQGDIHKIFGVKKLKIEDLIHNFDLDKFKHHSKNDKNFYVIPRVSNYSKTSFGLFQSKEFAAIIEKIASEVDFMVVDTPPTLPVSDALILSKYFDNVICVARHRVTRKRELNHFFDQFSILNNLKIHVVYNDFFQPKGMYGYNYYDYYSYKSYESNYHYKNEE